MEDYTLRDLIARWFFMISLTGRYSGSPESRMEQDLAELRAVKDAEGFIELLDLTIRDTLTEDFWNITLPNALATSSSRSPSLFAYYAALNLLDAKVLFSKMKVSELIDPAIKGTKAAIERHHLYPRGYLRTLGITSTRDTNQIANYALVEWTDNIDISDDPPSAYVPQYEARVDPGQLEKMRYWHAVPKGWSDMTYDRFLEVRRKAIAQVIRDGFEKLTAEVKMAVKV